MQIVNMTRAARFATIVIVAALLFSATPASAAAKPVMRDNAHFFEPGTVEQVNTIVKEIKDKFGKDLTIETFAVIPERLQPRFTAEGKQQFYEDWLNREAVAADTNGIFILIVKDPGHLEIGVGKRTREKAFTFADRDELRDLMLKPLHAHQYDDAITQAATFVLQRMKENLDGSAQSVATTQRATEPIVVAPPVREAPATSEQKPAIEADKPTTRPATAPASAPETKPANPGGGDFNK
jgi:uncharacterized membrane protein YgcG